MGGAVVLVVTYRKQKRAEDGQFLERLSAASGLLGDTNPTVQVAGIYALAALADESDAIRRQQCVDVMCGYLRLPYFLEDREGPRPTTTKETKSRTSDEGSREVEETFEHRPSDGQVRQTIIDVIRERLQPRATPSWSSCNFNFRNTTLDGGSFRGAVFRSSTDFTGSLFVGDVQFNEAKFEGVRVDFTGASFADGHVTFGDAVFASGDVGFDQAKFSGGKLDFNGARFTGAEVSFMGTKFVNASVGFIYATFSSRSALGFLAAKFEGCRVSFHGAKFKAGDVEFEAVTFRDSELDFRQADFSGGRVTFPHSTFPESKLDFRSPTSWSTPPRFPWDDDTRPAGVLPANWPPRIEGTARRDIGRGKRRGKSSSAVSE